VSRGTKPTTRRSPTQGGRELRARVSAEEYRQVQAAAEAEGVTVPAYVRAVVLGWRERDYVPAVMVEAVEGPAPPCLTCWHATTRGLRHDCRRGRYDADVWRYLCHSGALVSDDGLPTDRTLKCPGWLPREPT
jgi:hypothetical protein